MNKFLIVGLGNMGEKYIKTRHNIGFLVADELTRILESEFENHNFGSLAKAKYRGKVILVLKPDTYMNLSGNAVSYWLKKEKISVNNLLIITDDLNLAFGKIRLKSKGSNGGHNGLKSIETNLNSTSYPRLRIGIGKDFAPGEQIDFVLSKWGDLESKSLDKIIKTSCKMIQDYCFHGVSHAMNSYNGVNLLT